MRTIKGKKFLKEAGMFMRDWLMCGVCQAENILRNYTVAESKLFSSPPLVRFRHGGKVDMLTKFRSTPMRITKDWHSSKLVT